MDVFFDKVLLPALMILGTPLAGLIATYLTLLTVRLAKKAKIDVDERQEENIRRKIRGAILHTEKTFVAEARKLRAEDGHLSAADAGEAMKRTIRKATSGLGPKAIKLLANVTAKGQGALQEVIEEEVAALRAIPKVSETPQN